MSDEQQAANSRQNGVARQQSARNGQYVETWRGQRQEERPSNGFPLEETAVVVERNASVKRNRSWLARSWSFRGKTLVRPCIGAGSIAQLGLG